MLVTINVAGALGAFAAGWLTIALTVWLVIGVAVGWLAEERGRSMFTWFFIGLCFGPFAAILVGLAPRGTAGAYKRCPHCAESIRREAAVCPFCRTLLAAARETKEASIQPLTPVQKLALLYDQGRITDDQYATKLAELSSRD